MHGTRFELDEEKILREGEHDLDEIYAKIEELATKKAGLIKVSKNCLSLKGATLSIMWGFWCLVAYQGVLGSQSI